MLLLPLPTTDLTKWDNLTEQQRNHLVGEHFMWGDDAGETVNAIIDVIQQKGEYHCSKIDIKEWWEDFSVDPQLTQYDRITYTYGPNGEPPDSYEQPPQTE